MLLEQQHGFLDVTRQSRVHDGAVSMAAFGVRKGSSYGPREQGRYAAEFFTTVKTVYLRAV